LQIQAVIQEEMHKNLEKVFANVSVSVQKKQDFKATSWKAVDLSTILSIIRRNEIEKLIKMVNIRIIGHPNAFVQVI